MSDDNTPDVIEDDELSHRNTTILPPNRPPLREACPRVKASSVQLASGQSEQQHHVYQNPKMSDDNTPDVIEDDELSHRNTAILPPNRASLREACPRVKANSGQEPSGQSEQQHHVYQDNTGAGMTGGRAQKSNVCHDVHGNQEINNIAVTNYFISHNGSQTTFETEGKDDSQGVTRRVKLTVDCLEEQADSLLPILLKHLKAAKFKLEEIDGVTNMFIQSGSIIITFIMTEGYVVTEGWIETILKTIFDDILGSCVPEGITFVVHVERHTVKPTNHISDQKSEMPDDNTPDANEDDGLSHSNTDMLPPNRASLREASSRVKAISGQGSSGQSKHQHRDYQEPLSPDCCKYVKTRGYKVVKQALKDEGRVLVCGSPGSGKTYMAMVLQERYRKKDYNVISPRNIRDFCLHDFIHSQSKTFIVLDDIFGRFMANISELAHCFQLLDDIEHHIRNLERQKGNKDETSFKVLLNSRTDVYLDMEGRLERYKHFLLRPVCIVNLTLDEETKLQRDERGDILSAHLQHVGISMSDETRAIISEGDYKTLGFPYICQMFVERRTSSINPVDFFQKPLNYLDGEISRIFLDQQTKAAVLLLLILTDGSFNLALLTDPDTDAAKQLCKLYEILESLPSKESLPKELTKAAKSLIGTYLTCAEDVVTFSHLTIYDAVAYTVGKLSESFVLSHCSLKFIVERIVYKKDIVVSYRSNFKKLIVIGESYIEMLIQRLITEMQNGRIALSMSHQALLQKDVFEKFVRKLKVRQVLADIIHEKDTDENGLSFLFWASYTGVWKTGFLYVLEKPQFSDEEYLEAYLSACISNNLEAFQELKHFVGSLNEEIAVATLSGIARGAAKNVLANSSEEQKTMYVVSRRHDRNLDHLIHIASAYGHVQIVGLLLDMGVDVNDTGGMGMTSLMYGSYFGHHDLVELLLTRGADTEMTNDEIDNCLHLAVRGGFIDIVDMFLKTMDPDCPGRYDRTPLMYAAYDGHKEVVELLIEYGACLQPEKTEPNKNTSLHEACATGRQDIVELLLQIGKMDIEHRGYGGKTPLLAACRGGRLETIKFLTSKGVAKYARDDKGNNCVLLAAAIGDVATVQWLLDEEGFDKESQTYIGKTPLMCSVTTGNMEVFKFLLERGANIHARDNANETCMHHGAIGGSLEIVQDLTELGLGIDERGLMNRTPIMLSCMGGNAEVFNFLKECNARLTLKDENQANCLHLACRGADIKIVQNLLEMNIFDIEGKDIFGNTAFQMSVRKNSPAIMDILLQYGAKLQPGFLLSAAQYGCEEAAEKLLSLGLSVGFRGRNQMTPLMVACNNGNINISKQLLSVRPSQIHDKDVRGYTPLHFASATDCIVLLKYLCICGANKEELTNDGNSPLHVAAFSGTVKSVLFFIKLGVNVNIRNNTKKTPLMSAMVQTKINTEVVKALMNAGADVHVVSSWGDTLLHVAAEAGAHTVTVRELMNIADIDIDLQNNDGNTPIMIAALKGKEDVFMSLMSRGASLTSRNKNGETILHLACRSENVNREIVRELLRNGLNSDSRDNQGKKPDMYHVQERRREAAPFRTKSATSKSWRK